MKYLVKPDPIRHDDDPQKDRWGSRDERKGRRLRAVYVGGGKRVFDFHLVVESTDGSKIDSPVIFHLHDSYSPQVWSVEKEIYRDGSYAVLEDIQAYETFTAAAEVKDRNGVGVALELDLERVKSIPSAYKPKEFQLQEAGEERGRTVLRRRRMRPHGRPSGLEAILNANRIITTPVQWRRAWEKAESWVCRVNAPDGVKGTGILVGRDLVLTNWHVVRHAIGKGGGGFSFQFDYKTDAAVDRPTVRLAAKNWCADMSPCTDDELKGKYDGRLPSNDELDFALIRLQPSKDLSEAKRGYADLMPVGALPTGGGLIILQHPDGDPLSFAVDTNAIIGTNENGTRVRYATNTKAGSSGAPCFNMEWQLVALHHSGWPAAKDYTGYNQGIPIEQLRQRVEKARSPKRK